MTKKGKVFITQKTADELRAMGIDAPIAVGDPAAMTGIDIVVCVRRYFDEALIMSDNLISTCAACNHAIQFRPDVPRAPMKLCVECALQRLTVPMQ